MSAYQVWPCQTVGKPGNFTVAKPGDSPVFVQGAYHWPKAEAEKIAEQLNATPKALSSNQEESTNGSND